MLGVRRIWHQPLSGSWTPVYELRVPSALEALFPMPVFNLDPNLCLAANVCGEPVPQPKKPSDNNVPEPQPASSNPPVLEAADGPLDSALGLSRRLLFRQLSLRSKNQVRLGCLIQS